jgi:hypothetical protein
MFEVDKLMKESTLFEENQCMMGGGAVFRQHKYNTDIPFEFMLALISLLYSCCEYWTYVDISSSTLFTFG